MVGSPCVLKKASAMIIGSGPLFPNAEQIRSCLESAELFRHPSACTNHPMTSPPGQSRATYFHKQGADQGAAADLGQRKAGQRQQREGVLERSCAHDGAGHALHEQHGQEHEVDEPGQGAKRRGVQRLPRSSKESSQADANHQFAHGLYSAAMQASGPGS
eukprot:scaffold8481_cov286-Pinguiococcus_pyrenoidosus.AAC.5